PETEKMTVWVWVWAGAFSLYTVANTNEAVARDEARRAESLMPNCEPVRVEIDVLKRPRGRTPS
ncbi:MAG TPA: hypothetical protein VHA07_09980, partial [Devosia sp.]|nr:hypothetical protein [Devosia sp.]